jgi:hypothetical protein
MSLPTDPLVTRFAQRVAARDAPPPPPRQDRAAILERLITALAGLGVRLRNRRLTTARLCLALVADSPLTAVQLAAAENLCRQTVVQALAPLQRQGYVSYTKAGRFRRFGFTRAGEDWLLPLLTGVPASAAG